MLITAGLVVLTDAGLTLVWQEPLSAAYGAIKQGQAADQLNKLESQYPTPADLPAIAGVRGQRQEGADPRRPLRAASAGGSRDRADQDRPHRPRHRGHPGHGHGLAGEGPRPLQEHPAPGPARDGRDRRSPHHLPGPLPPHRPDPRTATRSGSRCRTRPSRTPSRGTRSSIPSDVGIIKPVGYDAARPDGLPSALQRRPALCGLRQAHPDRPLRSDGEGRWPAP